MKKLLRNAVDHIAKWIQAGLPTALLIIGALFIAIGIFLIYRPAGIIALGVQLMFDGVLLIKGGNNDNE